MCFHQVEVYLMSKSSIYTFLCGCIILIISSNVIAHGNKHSPVGHAAKSDYATQKIKVITRDTMRFEFSKPLNIKKGDIVSFIVTNQGRVNHEFSIGDKKEQIAHQAMMRKMPNMVHNDDNTVTVKPGETKTLTWQFEGEPDVLIACNIPGHYEAGMYKHLKVKTV